MIARKRVLLSCRVCGMPTSPRKHSGFNTNRAMLKHKCPHGQWCVAGRKGQMSQALTATCPECRRDGYYATMVHMGSATARTPA